MCAPMTVLGLPLDTLKMKPDKARALRQEQLARSDGQLERAVGAQVMADVLIRRCIIRITVQRIGPVLWYKSQDSGKDIGALEAQSGCRPHRNLCLHGV